MQGGAGNVGAQAAAHDFQDVVEGERQAGAQFDGDRLFLGGALAILFIAAAPALFLLAFTVALANHLTTPGLDIRRAFGKVRDDVLASTANAQEPYVYGSLGGEDVPLVPAPPAVAALAPNPNAEIRRDYELALQVGTRVAWNAFLKTHPDGFYADLAMGQLDKITSVADLPSDEAASNVGYLRQMLAQQGDWKKKGGKPIVLSPDAGS